MVFIRHFIFLEGMFIDLRKVEAVLKWKRPTNVTKICSFLGLTGYYRKFIEGFSTIAIPLN
jgi:hypothetical protein